MPPSKPPKVIAPPPAPPEVSTPVAVSTPAPEVAAVQGLDPAADKLVKALCLTDACVNGLKYAAGESYMLDPAFAAQFNFFKVSA